MSTDDVSRVEQALRLVIETAVAQKIEPGEVKHAVIWWEPYSESGATERSEIRKSKDFGRIASMLYSDHCMDQLRSVANDVRKIKWPEFVVDHTAEIICDCYFGSVGAVSVDDAAIHAIAEKYTAEVQADTIEFATVFQVAQFSAAEPFFLNDKIEFRPIAKAEIDQFGYEPLPIRQVPRLNKKDWICKVTQTYRADDISASHSSRGIWELILGSLGLVSDGDAWFSLLCEGPKSPFLQGAFFGTRHRIHSSPNGGEVKLDKQGIELYRNVFQTIETIHKNRSANLIPSFRRFRAAAGREIVDDKLTDLVIALESLLTPDSSTGEISYKFRMRGAALLPERFGTTSERVKLMNELYKARSSIVHSNKDAEKIDGIWMLSRATDVFRVIFDQLSRSPVNVKASITQLDEAMVNGGKAWLARP